MTFRPPPPSRSCPPAPLKARFMQIQNRIRIPHPRSRQSSHTNGVEFTNPFERRRVASRRNDPVAPETYVLHSTAQAWASRGAESREGWGVGVGEVCGAWGRCEESGQRDGDMLGETAPSHSALLRKAWSENALDKDEKDYAADPAQSKRLSWGCDC